jgi:nitroimidazol reductase NimA-like FMN-containing flavoprotein (pyridoxamine 5'-phosphate oxidase superfamily)
MRTDEPATVLTGGECWALAREAVVGRLAVVVDDRPEIFPVNYLVDHGTVVFQTAAGVKLNAAVDRPVAFEIDGYDASTGEAWSVVIKGIGREVTDLYEVLDAVGLPLETWHAGPKPRIVRIEADTVTGRRFPRATPAHRPAPRKAAPE